MLRFMIRRYAARAVGLVVVIVALDVIVSLVFLAVFHG